MIHDRKPHEEDATVRQRNSFGANYALEAETRSRAIDRQVTEREAAEKTAQLDSHLARLNQLVRDGRHARPRDH